MKYGFANKRALRRNKSLTFLVLNSLQITNTQRLAITGGYFGLIGALLAAMAIQSKITKATRSVDSRAGNGKIV